MPPKRIDHWSLTSLQQRLVKAPPQACLDAQITAQAYYRWRKEYGGTQWYAPILRGDEDGLTRAIITLASQYGRYGSGSFEMSV